MSEEVLAIKNEILNDYIGNIDERLFIPEDKDDFFKELINQSTFLERESAEKNYDYKQLIPYILIRHGDKYFMTKRTENQTEDRLHNKSSLGVGGHINPSDGDYGNIITAGMYRELYEEVKITEEYDVEFIGVINSDGSDVSSVHLGLLYVIDLEDIGVDSVSIKEDENMIGSFVYGCCLDKYYELFEDWSQVVYDNYIGSR